MHIEYILLTQTGALLVFFLKDFIRGFKNADTEHSQKIGDLMEEITELKVAIASLRTEIKYLSEYIHQIPEMKKDIDAAHEKLRRSNGHD